MNVVRVIADLYLSRRYDMTRPRIDDVSHLVPSQVMLPRNTHLPRLTFRFPHIIYEIPPNERYLMDLPESVMAESLDEIIRRSLLRLEQERVHVGALCKGGPQHASAKATLADGMQALDKLRAYRARLDKVER